MRCMSSFSTTPANTLSSTFTRRPVLTVIVLWLIDLLLINGFIFLARALFPAAQPDFVALFPGTLVVLLFIAVLRWWREVGYNAPAEWRELGLLILPALILVVIPLLDGIKPVDGAQVGYLAIGYLLTGVREESLYRGVLLRIVGPIGQRKAVLFTAVIFGLAHLSNLFVRSNPALVFAQVIGAFCFGVAFGALRLRTNTLWPLIVLHMLHDLLLQLSAFPALPLNVAQDVILLFFGLYLLWRMKDAAPQPEPQPAL